jgi:hypothetical protein
VENGAILLQGGITAGIRENCELKNITGKDRSLETRLRVIAVQGLNRCTAKLIQGNLEKIQPGDLFVMDRWAAGPGSRMKACIPVSTFPKVKVLGIDISSFSVFGSWLWTKEQLEDKSKELTKRQIQFGISFNLDKAMGWVN